VTSSLRRVVSSIGAVVAILTALSLPAAYFAAGYTSLSQRLAFEAELNASYLAKYINGHSQLWQFQHVRIAELLSQTDSADANFIKRVVDTAGKTVLLDGDEPIRPSITRSKPVTVGGSVVASVALGGSLRPLLHLSLFVALFSGMLGLGIFFTLRVFPLRVLDRTLGELERANVALAQTNDRFKSALAHMSHGLSMFNVDGHLVVSNSRFEMMYGVPSDAVSSGLTFRDLLKHGVRKGYYRGDVMMPDEQLYNLIQLGERNEQTVSAVGDRSIATVSNALPTGGWVSIHEDVTEKLASQARISHMALHDALTGLPNRVFLQQHLQMHLDQLGSGQQFAVLYIDLDRFKVVNDALGHPLGDRLLREVAARMRACLHDGEMLARIAGDEFVIVQNSMAEAQSVSALAAALIEAIGVPFDLDGHQATIGASVGIAIAPADASTEDDLLRSADMALYRAKADGRNTFRFFEPEMDRSMQARRALELDLRKAITNGEFVLHYQPLVNLQSGATCGFEALVRWIHPMRGYVQPLDFIPIAEETGLIVAIGEWVLRTACKEAANWPSDIRLAVNLSPNQFKRQNIGATVVSALAHSGLAPARLELEITESVLLHDNAATLATLYQIRNLGVRISMDDFGTGYSSLSYLRSFPFDKIKIDRSFVHDLERQEDSKTIVRAITNLGLGLGMAITGEGVETQGEADYLREEGCTEAQGYFFGKPVPAGDVSVMLAVRDARLAAVA
jgi:diguanylate cyclase (GGDEF)-like protein